MSRGFDVCVDGCYQCEGGQELSVNVCASISVNI